MHTPLSLQVVKIEGDSALYVIPYTEVPFGDKCLSPDDNKSSTSGGSSLVTVIVVPIVVLVVIVMVVLSALGVYMFYRRRRSRQHDFPSVGFKMLKKDT